MKNLTSKIMAVLLTLCGLSNVISQETFQCPHATYPGGLCAIDNKVYTSDGYEFKFYGVNRGQFESNFPNAYGQWIMDPTDSKGGIFKPGFDSIAAWGVNVVRLPLNQYWWNNNTAGTNTAMGTYREQVRKIVEGFRARNIRVILDRHTGDDVSATSKPIMATPTSKDFWQTLATEFKNDSMVVFELFNEPQSGIGWDNWLNGGVVNNVTYIGMQELYDAVRATGANNFVLIGGLDFAYQLDGVTCKESGATCTTREIKGYNIGYVTHIYPQYDAKRAVTSWEIDDAAGDPIYSWKHFWLYLADKYPVVVTELGPNQSLPTATCHAETAQIIDVANKMTSGWMAWGFWWYSTKGLIQQTGGPNWKTYPPAPTEWGWQVRDSIAALKKRINAPGGRLKAPAQYFTTTNINAQNNTTQFVAIEWTIYSILGQFVKQGVGAFNQTLELPQGIYIKEEKDINGRSRTQKLFIQYKQ